MNENPVTSNLSIFINLGEVSTPVITVYSMDGRVVLTHNAGTLNPGHNTVFIPGTLPNGSYMLHCSAGNRQLTERFAVVR